MPLARPNITRNNIRNTPVSSKLDPMDLFDVRSELSEDEIMVKETVGRFVDDKVIPLMREAFENHEFPRQLIKESAEL